MKIAVFTALFAAEIFALRHYIKIMYPKIGWNTLFSKALCSLVFVATAITAQMFSKGGLSINTMLAAFICSFFGDVFLHVYPKLGSEIVNYALGGVSFLAGHVLYILSFARAEKGFVLPENILAIQLVAAAFLCIAVNILMRVLGLKLGKVFTVPVIIYSFALMIMVVKAVTVGYMLFSSGGEILPAVIISVGAISFAASDIVLASDFFTGGKDLKKKVANMILYYGGQMLLATSLLWINLIEI